MGDMKIWEKTHKPMKEERGKLARKKKIKILLHPFVIKFTSFNNFNNFIILHVIVFDI